MRTLRRKRRSVSSIEAYACSCGASCASDLCTCGCRPSLNTAQDAFNVDMSAVSRDRQSKASQNNYRK